MTATANYLAVDLGASSGRVVLGAFDGERLTFEEIHRFDNRPVALGGRLYWNALTLFEEIKAAIRLGTQRGVRLDAAGIDTWGVDFALLGRGGELLEMPRHYRDPRTRGLMERVFERVPRREVYERTGIQFMPLNTLYQLLAVARGETPLLEAADRLLFMPDLFAYWLTGQRNTERTIASTSQMMNTRSGAWDAEFLDRLDLPARLLPPIRDTGTVAGTLLPEVSDECGQPGLRLIHTACHDTAAAVAAAPAAGNDWAYISSGTWSLVGVERNEPLITPEAMDANFTNEAGVAGTTRFLRNVAGLWLVQECQRTWACQGTEHSYESLIALAEAAEPLRSFVDPDTPRFADPGDMPARIREACREASLPVPESPGQVVRCALESLAMKYRHVLATLGRITGRRIAVLHVVGGGSRNRLLNQWTADATGLPVVAGPVEATAVGNLLVQALGRGRIGTLADLRRIVAASGELQRYEPWNTNAWDEAQGRFVSS